MEFRQALAALRATWWLPLVGVLVGGGVAAAVCLLQTPVYTSSTQFFVSTTDATSTSDVLSGSQFSQQRVASYARLLTSDRLLGRVIDQLKLDRTPEQLADDVTATAVPDTVLLEVSVTDTSAERARDIARAVGNQFASMVTEIEATAGTSASPVKVTVIDVPDVPDAPSEPQWIRNLAVGLVAGLLIGAALALARAKLDRSVRDPEEAAALVGAPVIATILRDESLSKAHVFTRTGSSRTAEEYRQLRNNLQFLNIDEPPKVIMITSAVPSEGKTTVTINLAVALAEAGHQVAVVESDLRRPLVSQYLDLVEGTGVTNILAGTADVDDVVQQFGNGVSVIASGPKPPNPGELLASSQMSALLDKLRADHDFVLVDAPPLLPVADASGLAAFADGVLLSVRYGTTRKDQLQQAAAVLGRVHAKVLGVVLNIVPPKTELAYGHGHGHGYGYGNPDHTDPPRSERI